MCQFFCVSQVASHWIDHIFYSSNFFLKVYVFACQHNTLVPQNLEVPVIQFLDRLQRHNLLFQFSFHIVLFFVVFLLFSMILIDFSAELHDQILELRTEYLNIAVLVT